MVSLALVANMVAQRTREIGIRIALGSTIREAMFHIGRTGVGASALAVPTVLPPLVHVVGAVVCGPNTLNVIVPVAPLVAPLSIELTELAAIAVLVLPVPGADTVVEVTRTVLVKPLVAVHEVL